MRVTIRQLQAFIAVARTGNFTRAAEQLRVAQPVVSGLVNDLEQELGFRLFDRTTRKVELTESATGFLDDAQRLTHGIEDAVGRARDTGARHRRHLRIGAPPLLAAVLLPKAMRAFADRAPDVAVTLVDRPVPVIYGLLREGELNLAIGTFLRTDAGISRLPLIADALSLLCREDHPLAAIKRPRWKDLAGLPLVTLHRGNGIREQMERGYASAGLEAAPAFEVEQLTTVVAMVEAGFGITVLPPYALSALPARGVVTRPLGPLHVTRKIEIVHRTDRPPSPAANDFIRLLRQHAARLQDALKPSIR